MQNCLREIAWIAATHDFQIHHKYINTKSNKLPDLLSRWYDSGNACHEFHKLTQHLKLKSISVDKQQFMFSNNW